MLDTDVIAKVGKVLTLMNAHQQYRDKPLAHDLDGNFDQWFDGGAVKYDTGISTWTFADKRLLRWLFAPGLTSPSLFPGERINCGSDGKGMTRRTNHALSSGR